MTISDITKNRFKVILSEKLILDYADGKFRMHFTDQDKTSVSSGRSMRYVEVEEVEWIPAADGGRPTMKPTGKKEVIEADMVLLAMGFLKPEQPKFAKNVFLAGDAETGASLVVRAIASGRKAATDIDSYLNK